MNIVFRAEMLSCFTWMEITPMCVPFQPEVTKQHIAIKHPSNTFYLFILFFFNFPFISKTLKNTYRCLSAFGWADDSYQQGSCSSARSYCSRCHIGRSNCNPNWLGYCWGKRVFKLIFQHRLEKSRALVRQSLYLRGLLRFTAEVLLSRPWSLKKLFSGAMKSSDHLIISPVLSWAPGTCYPATVGQFSDFMHFLCSLRLYVNGLYCLVC